MNRYEPRQWWTVSKTRSTLGLDDGPDIPVRSLFACEQYGVSRLFTSNWHSIYIRRIVVRCTPVLSILSTSIYLFPRRMLFFSATPWESSPRRGGSFPRVSAIPDSGSSNRKKYKNLREKFSSNGKLFSRKRESRSIRSIFASTSLFLTNFVFSPNENCSL